jgi:glycosyltransferase involved in cell wall biosynthesis
MKNHSLKLENSSKTLIFITSSFPYGNGETFIESEINQLSNLFDKVIIVSHDTLSKEKRNIPKNISIVRERYSLTLFEKIIALKGVFSRKFLNELAIIKSTYNKKVSLGILKTMILSLYNAQRLQSVYNKIINQYNVENVFCYSYWCNDSALSLSLLNKKDRNIKTFCRIHRWDVYFEESKYNYLPYRHLIYENLDAIFSISLDGIRYAEVNWKLQDSNKLKLSRLGVNNKFEMEFTDNAIFKLVSCSNLIPVKRVDLIMESLKVLENVSLEWIVIGDGDLREELEQQVSKLPLSIKVNFLGRVHNKQIYELYNELNPQLFINLSSSEGVPVSIMEAMSFGTPVIATNVGGTSEIVNNNNGYLLDSHTSVEKVAEKITEFYNLSIEEKNIKRKAAFDTWNDKYKANKNYDQFLEDILSL